MVSSSDFSADERRLCTGSWDKTVKVWDVNAGSYRYVFVFLKYLILSKWLKPGVKNSNIPHLLKSFLYG